MLSFRTKFSVNVLSVADHSEVMGYSSLLNSMEKIILRGNSYFAMLWKENNYGATWMDLLQNLITQKEITRIHTLLHHENKPKVNYVDASAVKTSCEQ